MVGSACIRKLSENGYKNLIFKSSKELDLRNQNQVKEYIEFEKPKIIINAAAIVGGILANDLYPYNFLMDNLLIQNNIIDSALKNNIDRLIFLGSSCIYPKYSPQPIKEEYLLTSKLEPTNQWYAIAKIAGLKLIEAINKQFDKKYISLMPTNLYGFNDNFDLNFSHVLPAMLMKFHHAKVNCKSEVVLWGSGKVRREFLNVDDLAEAIVFCIENQIEESILNVGTGEDIEIKSLANVIKKIVGFEGKILWDKSKPDGTPKKLLDTSKLNEKGWKYNIDLENGIKQTYSWYKQNQNKLRKIKF